MIFLIKKEKRAFKVWIDNLKTIKTKVCFSRLVADGWVLLLMVLIWISLSRLLFTLVQISLNLLKQFIKLLLRFNIFIEGNYFASELFHFWNLWKQNGIKFFDILFNIRTWFIDIFENGHFLFYNLNAFLATCIMFEN